MLLPRFSIRWLLLFTAVCGVGSLVLRATWRGEPWGGAVIAGILFIGVTLIVHAFFFAALWPLSLLVQSVFGGARQTVPPRQSEMPFELQDTRADQADV